MLLSSAPEENQEEYSVAGLPAADLPAADHVAKPSSVAPMVLLCTRVLAAQG